MTETADRPLVTFALFAYNQEQYIREAVEGAFAQTYEPLEIILSDDCSTDRTFEIMQEMAAAYEGPHEVRVRQSYANRGITGHINDIADTARSDILVMAAGDDVSAPVRTERLSRVFQNDTTIQAVFSSFSTAPTDCNPEPSDTIHYETVRPLELAYNAGGLGKGATYAYRLKCLTWPTKMDESLRSEDRILPMRAAMMGAVAFVREPLVFYRHLETGMSRTLRDQKSFARNSWPHISNALLEIDTARNEGSITGPRAGFYRTAYRLRYALSAAASGQNPANRMLGRLCHKVAKATVTVVTRPRSRGTTAVNH